MNNRKKMTKQFIATLLIALMMIPMCASAATYQELNNIKLTSNEIAEKARYIGLPDTHPLIQNSKQLWHEADFAIKNDQYDMYMFYTEADVEMLAKLMWGEGRGIASKTELACIVWTVLNRYDIGYGHIKNIVTAKDQFCYSSSFATVSDYGYDLKELARDVLNRWNKEKNGIPSDGRVLEQSYIDFRGYEGHNIFKNRNGERWDYSLPSPYEN